MSFADELRRVARAWDGDRDALSRLAQEDVDSAVADRHRATPALCRAAESAGISPPESWKRRRLATAGRQMLLEDSLRRVGKTLEKASIPWAPIKGLDLITRKPAVYETSEDRPTSDLDILIPEHHLDDARRVLGVFGARDLTSGPRGERYLRDEGYAWQAALPSTVLLEVHFRLWAQVPIELPAALLDAALPDSALPDIGLPGALRLHPAHAYLLAAVHAFTVGVPRGAGIWRDLTELGRAYPELADRVVDEAERFDLQLPVSLAAAISAELWGSEPCADIAAQLRRSLRRSERTLAGAPTLPLSRLALARHLAGRRARHGLVHAAWRRLWPHPGVVEASTPDGWWPLRRLRLWLRGRV